MITKIGIIYQDLNSLGFLQGLRDRLGCTAEFVPPPAAIGKQRVLTRKQAKEAWRRFKEKGVDLVVRFTDADGKRWQKTQRDELQRVPDEARSSWICGVAVNNPEEWLALDVAHLASSLNRPPAELADPEKRTGVVKHAIDELAQRNGRKKSEVVARIVRDAPADVFRRWLKNDALRKLYSDCRLAATRANCETPNELEAKGSE